MDTIKVLMVDDESRMRKLVKDFLTREGYIGTFSCEKMGWRDHV